MHKSLQTYTLNENIVYIVSSFGFPDGIFGNALNNISAISVYIDIETNSTFTIMHKQTMTNTGALKRLSAMNPMPAMTTS